jgi:crotonobetainyl-CoA:carnitine CoA-transferase CaiB-like acyl-CoA transferase
MLLAGIRVIELANVISGPYAGLLLADLGAEVIKIEAPELGDPFRGWQETQQDISPAFFAMNRGKQSITINLKTLPGQALVRQLVKTADVLIENFRPGVMARLGLDYEQLKSFNPTLVYCAITGMGRVGPARDQPVFDAIAQAYSGLWSQLSDLDRPQPVGPPLSDQLSGQQAAQSILAALVGRQRTGEGCRLDISMLGATLAFQPLAIASYAMQGVVADKSMRARSSQSFGFVDCAGQPFAVHLSSPAKFWERLVVALAVPELAIDARFAQRSGRIAHYDALQAALQAVFRHQTRSHWISLLLEHEVPVSAIHTIEEALNDEHIQAEGLIMQVLQESTHVAAVSSAAKVDGNMPTSLGAPLLGAHTETVLAQLGYEPQDIAQLRTQGVIQQKPPKKPEV